MLMLGTGAATVPADEYVILPVVGIQPDTGLQAGVAAFWESEPVADSYGANLYYVGTQKNQHRLILGGRMPGPVSGKRDYFEAELYLSRFPSEFFGYRATYLAEGARFDEQTVQLKLGWSYPLSSRWRVGAAGVAARAAIEFDDPESTLLTEDVRWTEGGAALALDLSLTRDTRNREAWPSQGTLGRTVLRLGVDDASEVFVRRSQSFAAYTQLPADVVLAFGAQVQAATANTPFVYMPTLTGAQWLRGVQDGQYRHRTTIATQVEARMPLTQRFAATTFVHIGQVAATPQAWWDEDWKQGGGAGLRYAISEQRRLNVRLDVGWVDGRSGVVLNLGEAF